jgi:hypothetical protein
MNLPVQQDNICTRRDFALGRASACCNKTRGINRIDAAVN